MTEMWCVYCAVRTKFLHTRCGTDHRLQAHTQNMEYSYLKIYTARMVTRTRLNITFISTLPVLYMSVTLKVIQQVMTWSKLGKFSTDEQMS